LFSAEQGKEKEIKPQPKTLLFASYVFLGDGKNFFSMSLTDCTYSYQEVLFKM
jgi:hypothetical protein